MTMLRYWSGLLLLCCTGLVAAGEKYFARYALPGDAASVDIGVQPLGYPAAMIGALLQRDRILKRRLEGVKLAKPHHGDEVATLAAAFNSMAARFETWHATLASEVATRTRELITASNPDGTS